MNIAYIIPSLKPMGPINVVYDLVRLMLDHGHECDVYYFDDFEIDNYFPCPANRISLSTKIDFNHYDIVHSHGLRPNIYVFRHKPFNCKGTRFITTFHNYVFQDFCMKYGKLKGTIGGILFLLTAKRHDKIIALSKDAQRYYQKWFNKNKVTFIYNTRIIDANATLTEDEKKELMDFKGNGTLIGMNGSIIFLKGIDIILKAMVHLPERFKLFLVGDGCHMEKLKSLSDELNLGGRVYFAGKKVDAYRYPRYYDIYVLPSRSEGFPLALLEAACQGSRIVCSNLPILQEAFDETEVIMFPLPDDKALAECIIKAETAKDIQSQVQKKFNQNYSPEHFYKNHIKLYSEK